jgi:hypothetical protein
MGAQLSEEKTLPLSTWVAMLLFAVVIISQSSYALPLLSIVAPIIGLKFSRGIKTFAEKYFGKL